MLYLESHSFYLSICLISLSLSLYLSYCLSIISLISSFIWPLVTFTYYPSLSPLTLSLSLYTVNNVKWCTRPNFFIYSTIVREWYILSPIIHRGDREVQNRKTWWWDVILLHTIQGVNWSKLLLVFSILSLLALIIIIIVIILHLYFILHRHVPPTAWSRCTDVLDESDRQWIHATMREGDTEKKFEINVLHLNAYRFAIFNREGSHGVQRMQLRGDIVWCPVKERQGESTAPPSSNSSSHTSPLSLLSPNSLTS